VSGGRSVGEPSAYQHPPCREPATARCRSAIVAAAHRAGQGAGDATAWTRATARRPSSSRPGAGDASDDVVGPTRSSARSARSRSLTARAAQAARVDLGLDEHVRAEHSCLILLGLTVLLCCSPGQLPAGSSPLGTRRILRAAGGRAPTGVADRLTGPVRREAARAIGPRRSSFWYLDSGTKEPRRGGVLGSAGSTLRAIREGLHGRNRMRQDELQGRRQRGAILA